MFIFDVNGAQETISYLLPVNIETDPVAVAIKTSKIYI